MFDSNTSYIAGIKFVNSDANTLSNKLLGLVSKSYKFTKPFFFVPAGSVYFAELDSEYRKILNNGFCIPDGKSISVISRLTSARINQIRGVDFFYKIIDQGRRTGVRHFFYGTTSENLVKLSTELTAKFPGMIIAGTLSPSFGPLNTKEIQQDIKIIEQSNPDFIWVGMSSPKQDFVSMSLSSRLHQPVLAVGAAFDFASGAQKLAPKIATAIGAEWFFRFLSNPKRLWRRYLIGNLVFLFAVIKYWNTARE